MERLPGIPEHFSRQVERTPDRVAVSSWDGRLTYRELDDRAERLADALVDLGAGPDRPVAVLMRRSVDLVATLLAVVKAGAWYVPLHEAYPVDRMRWMVDRAGATILVTDEPDRPDGVPRVSRTLVPARAAPAPARGPLPATRPDQLAYVMFTSGTGGEPKGVEITHRGVLSMAADSRWGGGAHDRVLMIAPYAFGVSAYELWTPLLRGGRLVLAPPGTPRVADLARLLAAEEITAVHLTAGLFRVVAEEAPEALVGVREVLTGGDVIAPRAVARVLAACPDTVVRAMYGQTEATAFVLSNPMRAPYRPGTVVPVGAPMDGVRAYVLDEGLARVPDGTVGELFLGGDRLARGYLGRPELTAERFPIDPFTGDGSRMYRTGDLVRVNGDGLVEFVGRANDEVKIRGYRVELGEIEAVLGRHPGLAHVAVLAHESAPGEKSVVAYVVGGDDPPDPAALREHARAFLPDYMLPAAFVTLPALPLTPNGKLDRAALPVPDLTTAQAYRPPETERQEVLCQLFAEVLGAPRVGLNDNFFDLGGQSLLGMRLVSRLRAVLGLDVSMALLFDAPTVADLDAALVPAAPPPAR